MEIQSWLIYLLAAAGLSLSPGPNSLLALTHGALHGRQKALYTVAGGSVGSSPRAPCTSYIVSAMV